ncbi:transposase [Brucella sp. 2280]|nr:transposase [Brucella sp. 2280]
MRITSFFMDVPPEADQSHHHQGDGLRRQPERCQRLCFNSSAFDFGYDSGTMRGKCMIAGGRRALRYVLHLAAIAAAYHNPVLKSVAQ